MKIQLYDSKGKQILPITTEKARKMLEKDRVKPISKNPPKMKLKKDMVSTPLSRRLFLLYRKYGEKSVKTTALTCLIALAVIASAVGFVLHHNNANEHSAELITPTEPHETQQLVTETTTKPTETTTAPTTTPTQRVVVRETTKRETETRRQRTTETERRTEETVQRETTRQETVPPTTKKQTKPTRDNGLPSPVGGDSLPEPDSGSEELPIL